MRLFGAAMLSHCQLKRDGLSRRGWSWNCGACFLSNEVRCSHEGIKNELFSSHGAGGEIEERADEKRRVEVRPARELTLRKQSKMLHIQSQQVRRGLLRLPAGQRVCCVAAILLFIGWSRAPAVTQAAAPVAGDGARGEKLFEKRCSGCHAMDMDKEGPRLRHVYGRPAGTVPTFKYSSGLQASHITWDTSNLDRWLADPDAVVADNDMAFHVGNAEDRRDIIRFLQQSSGQ
jgi:cytochrome c